MAELRITTDPSALDVGLIHRFLSQQSTWAKGRPLDLAERCDRGLALLRRLPRPRPGRLRPRDLRRRHVREPCGRLRLPEHRGKGYAKALMRALLAHPELQGLRRFTLATSDAHGLYRQFGFTEPVNPHTFMERYFPDIYASRASPA